jgi:hypothetical protein
VCLPHSDQGAPPGGGGFQPEQGGSVEAACHKECQIAKRDRNENRIKRRKARERGDSSDEDLSPETSWSGDVPSAEVDWSNMSGSSLSSPPRATEVSSSRWPQTAGHDKNVGSNSRQAVRPAREDQRTVRPRVAPSRMGASESQRAAPRQVDPPEAVGGATGSCPLTFQRFRPPQLGLLAEASIASKVDGLGVDAERVAGGGFWHRPAAPVVVTYQGRRSPGRSCFPRRRRGPRTNPGRRRSRRINPRAVGGAHCRR